MKPGGPTLQCGPAGFDIRGYTEIFYSVVIHQSTCRRAPVDAMRKKNLVETNRRSGWRLASVTAVAADRRR